MAALSTMVSCGHIAETPGEAFVLDTAMTTEQIQSRAFTPEVMWKMGRAGAAILAPNGSTILYTLTRYNLEQNRSSTSLWLQPFRGGEPKQLTKWGFNDGNAQWNGDGTAVYFTSNRENGNQIWRVDVASQKCSQLSNIEAGVNGFGIAKNDKVWYVSEVAVEKIASSAKFKNMPQSKALIYDDLMCRHWDYWEDGSYSHLFIAELKNGYVINAVDVTDDQPWDVPTAPYFDNSEIAWNNAGTAVAYTARKLQGYQYSISTNTDIYLYDVASKTTKNLTDGMPGYDKYPRFSPDDKMIAWQSMERAGNESDKDRLFIMNADGKDKKYLTQSFDYNAANLVWGKNNDEIFFISPIEATHQICRVGLNGVVNVITKGDHDYTDFTKVDQNMAAGKTTISMATEFFSINIAEGGNKQISFINKDIYDNIDLGKVVKRWVTTTDNKKMLTWVILPTNFDSTKKYPTLLFCQGGPQSVVSNGWSYRWNFQLMANQGYIIVAPNRRGLPSFGQEWLEQISGDYSGQNIKDYLSAIDNVSKESWSDQNNLGCVGASYGGYSVFYLAGNHGHRFKAFISHCGIFDFTSMYGSTEELWFVNNDYGGPYWDLNNKVAQRSYANSPHHFVNKWNTPILIITGMKDFRIPYTQSLEAFTAARAHGVESRLVAFEDEAHQVFKPQNNIVWNNEFFGWLDKYLKK